MAEILSYAGALWWSAAFVILLATIICGLAQPLVQRRRARRKDQPPVSAILPVKLLNGGFETAQGSLFAQDYPEYEVLISAAHPARSSRFFHSAASSAVSPKLNNLAAPLAAVQYDLILTKDSNITLGQSALASFVQNLTADAGLVCAVPVAVRPENLAGRVEACLING